VLSLADSHASSPTCQFFSPLSALIDGNVMVQRGPLRLHSDHRSSTAPTVPYKTQLPRNAPPSYRGERMSYSYKVRRFLHNTPHHPHHRPCLPTARAPRASGLPPIRLPTSVLTHPCPHPTHVFSHTFAHK
jgi:hypothetical protein